MPEESGQERTEEATPRKREKAREEGQVARSVEIPSVIVLLASIVTLYFLIGFVYGKMHDLIRRSLSFDRIPLMDIHELVRQSYHFTFVFFITIAPVLLAAFIAALFSNFIQVGFTVSWQAIEAKPDKLDPMKGFGRIFSKKSAMELVKSIFKIIIIASVAYSSVKGSIGQLFMLYDNTIEQIVIFILNDCFRMFFWVLVAMFVLAAIDFGFQKWSHEQQLKMSKQEIKDEYKQTEGDPQIKSRIRSIQMQAARQRMMHEVPKADVVVTNPTHFAVALQYDTMNMTAPKVIAKGAGAIALKIREIAAEAGVPVVENPPLARNLYKLAEIGDEVPPDLYQTVAEILAYVYKLKGKKMF
ncbi:flagellar biosynthesis protein FlhB [Desulforegula conservatrix]|uniref:flagellar biosynthesis protein FlhB n=1 Tax=Desulforegula conservatrix TaxID=153026 RepID=UPI000413012C|nr:flagellar biosynthesis protein FlhB [Desulforegula conservatrix]